MGRWDRSKVVMAGSFLRARGEGRTPCWGTLWKSIYWMFSCIERQSKLAGGHALAAQAVHAGTQSSHSTAGDSAKPTTRVKMGSAMNWGGDEMDARVGKDIIHKLMGNLTSLVLVITGWLLYYWRKIIFIKILSFCYCIITVLRNMINLFWFVPDFSFINWELSNK